MCSSSLPQSNDHDGRQPCASSSTSFEVFGAEGREAERFEVLGGLQDCGEVARRQSVRDGAVAIVAHVPRPLLLAALPSGAGQGEASAGVVDAVQVGCGFFWAWHRLEGPWGRGTYVKIKSLGGLNMVKLNKL